MANFLISRGFPIVKIAINGENFRNFHCVMSMHECIDAMTTCLKIGELFSLKMIAFLQLPPFYGERQRLKNIEEARHLWLEAVEDFEKRLSWGLIREAEHSILKSVKRLLSHFDLILAVSRSIPIEMGEEWSRRVISLDPGVALSQEDVHLIDSVLKEVRKKEEIIIFGGRASPDKGIIEALIAFKKIKRDIGQNYKLVITGRISNETLKKIRSFCDKIKIKDNVLFYGFVPRKERLALIAKSKSMLYPSHVDAFPYAVLESLYLNTPVVAYDIPALRTYYNCLEGVSLVKELDIEALAQKVVETIERRNTSVERPKFTKSWDKIMDEETNLIKGFIKNISQ
ncbi:MAG: glycosyltransferase [Candidatus Bathyarchaeia archaeon]